MKTAYEIICTLDSITPRSAWNKGVKRYALSILYDIPLEVRYDSVAELEKVALNGAKDWKQYSWGGCSLCYNEDIARRLCTPSELKATRNGQRRPNAREEWPDVQARALYQAWLNIARIAEGTPALF